MAGASLVLEIRCKGTTKKRNRYGQLAASAANYP